MLVLSRKTGEAIVIGADLCVTVLGIHGNRIKLGVTAPRGVPINRHERQPQVNGSPAAPPGRGLEAPAETSAGTNGTVR
jgi:carbon storage regulator